MKTTYIARGLLCLLLLGACTSPGPRRPSVFVSLSDVDPSIELDIRYDTPNNFVGRPIEGYHSPKCLLTRQAATALARAQREARAEGYSLKVYDCYRPQRAVSDFVSWARDATDTRMQHRFYPAVPKDELFPLGYIAERSGHSRGSTMDLTLVSIGSHQPGAPATPDRYDCRGRVSARYPDNSIDMGTGFDCFDVLAHTDNPRVDEVARAHRERLKSIMEGAGFVNYPKEWWHYTLKDEPFPQTYFDFPVE